jgi:transcriptional regulator with XRE-family HTH domain
MSNSDIHEFRQVLADSIKALRVNAGLTQVELSNRLGVSVVHISTLENGHALPSIDLLRAYNSICGRDPYILADEILYRKKDKP